MGSRNNSGIADIGISAIATFEPAWKLANGWFENRIARKFVQHTGTEERPISTEDEVSMAIHAVENLRKEAAFDVRDCAGVVFVSPSFLPRSVAARYLDRAACEHESLQRAAQGFAWRIGLNQVPVVGMNWFCSGYAKGMSTVMRIAESGQGLTTNQFILLTTSTRISRITDFGCEQTAPLFGDLATATLVARVDSEKYPARFRVLSAFAKKVTAPGVYFDFDLRENVLRPADNDRSERTEKKIVFSLDGLGIADIAPRAMASAVVESLENCDLEAKQVRHIVPHQAGTGIIRLAALKLEQSGVAADVVNGITGRVGNVSSSSIPFALKQKWNDLDGIVACPTAAVGSPGRAEVSKGCVMLEAIRTSAPARKVA